MANDTSLFSTSKKDSFLFNAFKKISFQYLIHKYLNHQKKFSLSVLFIINFQIIDIFHLRGNRDKEKKILRRMKDISKELDYKRLEIDVAIKDARYLLKIGSYKISEMVIKNTVERFRKILHPDHKAALNSILSLILQDTGRYKEAENAIRNSIKHTRNWKRKSILYNNLGRLFAIQYDIKKARRYYNIAFRYAKKSNDFIGLCMSYNNLGVVSGMTKKYGKALKYFNHAYRIARKIGDRHNESMSLANIGNVYYERKEFRTARDFLFKAVSIRKKSRDKLGLIMCYHNIANSFHDQMKLTNAIRYYRLSLKDSIENNVLDGILYNSAMLAEIFYRKNMLKDAKKMFNLAWKINSRLKIKSFSERLQVLKEKFFFRK